MTDTYESDAPRDIPAPRGFAALARWKKVLVIAAGLLVVAGLALIPFEGGDANLSTSPGGSTLQPAGAGGTEIVGQSEPDMSPAFLKLGFSFFAAFAIGLAMRSFLRIALIFIGLQLLALFGLAHLEWVEVHWETISTAFDRFVANVQSEAGSFKTFVTGSLPQAGLATMGLVAGLKR